MTTHFDKQSRIVRHVSALRIAYHMRRVAIFREQACAIVREHVRAIRELRGAL